MAKLLSTQKISRELNWYQEIQSSSFYNEADLDRVLLFNMEVFFPEFYSLLFNKELINRTNGRKNKPDLALVKKDYSDWYIIEVELNRHPINHIFEQFHTFYNAIYTDEHANYIYNKRPDILELEKLKQMICRHAPKLMLIIDEFNSELKDKIKEFNCIMCVFQIFLDNEDKSIFRLNGEHPLIFTDFSHCIIEKRLPYAIRILDKYFLDACNISNGQEVKLLYYDRLSKWKREDFGNFVYLISESNYFPFDASTNRYRISYNINSTTFNISKS